MNNFNKFLELNNIKDLITNDNGVAASGFYLEMVKNLGKINKTGVQFEKDKFVEQNKEIINQLTILKEGIIIHKF